MSRPHPLLKNPSIFSCPLPADVHLDVVRKTIAQISPGAIVTTKKLASQQWRLKPAFLRIDFPTLPEAEQGLARLQGEPVSDGRGASFPLFMAHAPPNQRGVPTCRPPTAPISFAVRVHNTHNLHPANDSEAYHMLRSFFGPLHSFRVCENALAREYAYLVQFWENAHAEEAMQFCNPANRASLVSLHKYDSLSILCSNIHHAAKAEDIRRAFETYAIVLDVVLSGSHDHRSAVVTFRTDTAAWDIILQSQRGKPVIVCGKPVLATIVLSPTSKESTDKPPKSEKDEKVNVEDDRSSIGLPSPPPEPTLLPENKDPQAEIQPEDHATRNSSHECQSNCVSMKLYTDLCSAHETSNKLVYIWKAETERFSIELARLHILCLEEVGHANGVSQSVVDDLEAQIADLSRRLNISESRNKIVELQLEDQSMTLRAAEVQLARERNAAAEARRKLELEESRKRMRDLEDEQRRFREAEKKEAERRAKAEAERIARAEVARKKAEQERKAKEEAARRREEEESEARERARIEAERQAALERKRRRAAWTQATQAETRRCMERDRTQWGPGPWTITKSLARFRARMSELEQTKFSESKPFTVSIVPWPIVGDPSSFTLDNLDWAMVDDFFGRIQLKLPIAEFKDLVQKVHLMFHPDRWRSRGYLTTVQQEQVREGLERAGNVVSQAVTPLWRKSRSW